jgi:glycosyltransferase involved in cell wall biosynthesis
MTDALSLQRRINLALDVTRLTKRLDNPAPTGIDRVDLAYMRAFSAAPDMDLDLVTTDAMGPGMLSPRLAGRILGLTSAGWTPRPAEGGEQADIIRFIESPPGAPRPRPRTAEDAPASRLGPFTRALRVDQLTGGRRLRRWMQRGHGQAQPLYLHTSHSNLDRPERFRWLAEAAVPAIFFVHDLIPLHYPEYCREGEAGRHVRRLETIHRHARLILVNSDATRRDLAQHFAAAGMAPRQIEVAPLGIESDFRAGEEDAPVQAQIPYFVVLGTIEPRKNHLLLLQVWRRLVERLGVAAPRLVIIGRRGWENQTVFNHMDRIAAHDHHVIECNTMSDRDLRRLMRGAAALLTPSFAEGFGLPAAEALSLGTPAIVSDIEAHREVYGDCADYLDPLDGRSWLEAIEAFSAPASPRRAEAMARARRFVPPTWQGHMDLVWGLIRDIGRGEA